ncbi:unnamed protein product [Dicrocoelium dendriticum]|nr:unnamed protein product [Dicrocoelium dendriticum]
MMYVRVASPSQDFPIQAQLNSRPNASAESHNPSDNPTIGSIEMRVHQALTDPFITLCQPGPNSFVLVPKVHRPHTVTADTSQAEPVNDTRRPRFRVVIGPQLCSCQNDPPYEETGDGFRQPDGLTAAPCVHVLFVMLKVLNTPTDDVCLRQIPLPTAKAESLIRAYWKSRTTLLEGQRTLQNCHLSFVPNVDLQQLSCAHKIPSPAVPPQTSLFIPKAVHPSLQVSSSGCVKTPQLLALVNATVRNSPDCNELSALTKDIKPAARREVESTEATGREGIVTSVAFSPTSSSESIESARSRVSKSTSTNRLNGCESTSRRPQTVPQPELPLRQGAVRIIRHACSTTFRPIRDFSPFEENRLPSIQSENTSTYGTLANDSRTVQDTDTRVVASTMKSPEPVSSFSHVNHSPFKPVGMSHTSAAPPQASLISGLDDNSRGTSCALCLQAVSSTTCLDDSPVRCLSTENQQHCRATFHLSCSQLWLEEMAAEGDTPHCPVCMNRWLSVPLTKEASKCNVTAKHTDPTDCCFCQRETSFCEQPPYPPAPGPVRCSIPVLRRKDSTQEQAPSDDRVNKSIISKPEVSVPHSNPSSAFESQATGQNYIPYPEYKTCVAAFSLEVADGIASRYSATRRQVALQRAAQMTVHRILLARQRHQYSQSRSSADRNDETEDKSAIASRATRNNIQGQSVATEPDCLRVMFRLIQHLLDDPVDAVFIDSLRAFRELLGYLVCFNAETQIALQRAIGPILRRLLRFVGGPSVLWALRDHTSGVTTSSVTRQSSTTSADKSADLAKSTPGTPTTLGPTSLDTTTNPSCRSPTIERVSPPDANLRDRANLALATLVELAKGQSGALAIGRDVGCANQCIPVCGLQHMTRFVLSSAKFHATHLIGRLTLLDKLIRIDQGIGCQPVEDASAHQSRRDDPGFARLLQNNHPAPLSADRLARRHLCSGLVFARRHLLPPVPNSEQSVGSISKQHPTLRLNPTHCSPGTEATGIEVTTGLCETQVNLALDSLYNTQLKASRVARRVFLTASRALLTYGNRVFGNGGGHGNINPPAVYSTHEFCPREFVELEINRTEAPLAAWLRSKLAPLLYPNLVLNPEIPLIPIRMTVSDAPHMLQGDANCLEKDKARLPVSQTLSSMPSAVELVEPQATPNRTNSSSPKRSTYQPPVSPSTDLLERPPLPPPRRFLRFVPNNDYRSQDPVELDEGQTAEPSHFVRVALEPAYDLVALSASGNYIGVSECEDEDAEAERDRQMDRADEFERTILSDEPTYGGRSLGSEAELQTEQAAVLRSALRRSSRSLKPLLPVPALSIVMDAFRSTNTLPSADEYYESIDWVRGPILGHGAFSQCYQARDTRTGLLMAVKRIRLGGGSVLPIRANKAKAKKTHHTDKRHSQSEVDVDQKNAHQNGKAPQKSCGILTAEATAQLAEVQAEVNIMLQLNHPNVLRLFGAVCCSQRGLVDLFIEWMPGGSVNDLLRQYGAFNESVTLAYGVQVVRGLAYLHKHGILHRDLKGANLLVDTSGSVVRISDFGASAKLSGEKSIAGQFQGQVIGTFSFMAPEVLRGETYGRACDIWSVGCCLIEMLTGQPPWHDAQFTNRYALMFAEQLHSGLCGTRQLPSWFVGSMDPLKRFQHF